MDVNTAACEAIPQYMRMSVLVVLEMYRLSLQSSAKCCAVLVLAWCGPLITVDQSIATTETISTRLSYTPRPRRKSFAAVSNDEAALYITRQLRKGQVAMKRMSVPLSEWSSQSWVDIASIFPQTTECWCFVWLATRPTTSTEQTCDAQVQRTQVACVKAGLSLMRKRVGGGTSDFMQVR